MARPRKSEHSKLATVKIENAFWKLLETEKYSDITVLRISQESGVNRNSFYYHYKDMDDLAYQAFKNNAQNEASRMLISKLLSLLQAEDGKSEPSPDISILPHSKRIMLCARSDSPHLNQLVSEFLKEIWLDSFSIKEELLTLEEKLQINFIFAGVIATLGSQEIKDSPFLMLNLARSELGKPILSTMTKIALSQQNHISDESSS